MRNATATLARSITRSSSKQSYLIARWLVDKDLVDDCLRAYAYFRWADDVIDVSAQSSEERIAFIRRQKLLVDRLYLGDQPEDLIPEEEIIADLIKHDRGKNSGLGSFIRRFLDVLEFDAQRKGRPISQAELTWYSSCLGVAVTDAIQYFIGNEHSYSAGEYRYLAATAAHMTHMLRDMSEDLTDGFVNIPCEWLEAHDLVPHDLSLQDVESPVFRTWVRDQVELAREYFFKGRCYIEELDNLRCKLAASWYCARFECVLDAIERDGYTLRPEYNERRKLSTRLKIGWLGVSLTLKHFFRRKRRSAWNASTVSNVETTATEH